MLETRELNETDELLLNHLREGRITPKLGQIFIGRDGKDVGRIYVQQRLKRLSEHGHVVNVEDTGVYELVNDPEVNGGDKS